MPNQRTVLVVEDDEPIRESLRDVLELEGYQVYTAINGKEGLAVLRSVPHSCVVLLDLFMPVMNGAEFLHAVRQECVEDLKAVPVVLVSAAPPEGEALSAVKPLADGFLKKPLDLARLLQIINKFCSCEAAPPHRLPN